jgi:ribosomal protein L7/L12
LKKYFGVDTSVSVGNGPAALGISTEAAEKKKTVDLESVQQKKENCYLKIVRNVTGLKRNRKILLTTYRND